VGGNQPI